MKLKGFRTGRSSVPPQEADQAAVYWAARRRLRTMGAKDEVAFARWLENPLHRAAFDAADGMVEAASATAPNAEILRMREAALSSYPPPRRGRTAGWAVAAVAALVAVGLWVGRTPDPLPLASPRVVAADAVPLRADSPDPRTLSVEAGKRRYATGVGERQELRLADGSVIALNTASAVVVNYTETSRGVQLLRGQALFEVATDPARPFVVTAGDRRITAVGTAFDVRVEGAELRVVMIEGRVKVDPIRNVGLNRLIPLLARNTLDAGEQLIADSTRQVTVSVADLSRDVSWREGRLVFRHDTLAEAVAEINRYSKTQLVIEDARAAELRISGVFSTNRPENFVSALSAYYPVDVRPRAPRVIGLGWRVEPPPDGPDTGGFRPE